METDTDDGEVRAREKEKRERKKEIYGETTIWRRESVSEMISLMSKQSMYECGSRSKVKITRVRVDKVRGKLTPEK